MRFESALIVLADGEDETVPRNLATLLLHDGAPRRYLMLRTESAADPAPGSQDDAQVVDRDDAEGFEAVLAQANDDVIVLPSTGLPRALQASAEKCGRPIAWSREVPPRLSHIGVPVLRGTVGALAMAVLLRTRVSPHQTIVFLVPAMAAREPAWSGEDVARFLGADVSVQVRTAPLSPTRPIDDLLAHLADQEVDLLTLPTGAFRGFAGEWLERSIRESPRPLALLFAPRASPQPLADRLDAADLVVTQPMVGYVQREDAIGVAHAAEIQSLVLYSGGTRLGEVEVEDGRFQVDALDAEVLGLASAPDGNVEETDTGTLIRAHRPGPNPIALIDAAIDPTQLSQLDEAPESEHAWAVRLDHHQVFSTLRSAFAQRGIRAVIDAGAVLDDGHPDDIPGVARAIRLERVARRLERAGFVVSKLVIQGDDGPELLPRTPASTTVTSASSIELELNNHRALESVLRLIRSAKQSVHLQIYIFDEDAVAAQFAGALAAAAAGGVRVRVLVDSVFSKHRSLGMTNPLLEQLENDSDVEIRCAHLVSGVPPITALKRRDHRKLLIIDQTVAMIGGRNIGLPYYTSFEEAALTESTEAPDIPWLDASFTVQGPVVQPIDASFSSAWRQAGGDDFPLASGAPPGPIPVRVVVHEGLKDANTLDAQRDLFDSASDHIYVVNTFPLQFELQSSLLRALKRGVAVHYLVGNPRPYHGDFVTFPGWAVREVAARLVFGRLDPLVHAGARVHELGVPHSPAWSETLSMIYPHVHAKLFSCDGKRLLVGSANVDISSAYWESELALVVEDAEVVTRAEGALEQLFVHSRPIPPPEKAGRREWIARLWPSLLG